MPTLASKPRVSRDGLLKMPPVVVASLPSPSLVVASFAWMWIPAENK